MWKERNESKNVDGSRKRFCAMNSLREVPDGGRRAEYYRYFFLSCTYHRVLLITSELLARNVNNKKRNKAKSGNILSLKTNNDQYRKTSKLILGIIAIIGSVIGIIYMDSEKTFFTVLVILGFLHSSQFSPQLSLVVVLGDISESTLVSFCLQRS